MVVVGIDVSKGKSTVAVVGEGKKVIQKPFDVAHTKTEMLNLVSFVKSFGEEVYVVMEHTGIYYKVVAETLHKAGIRVSAVNPVLICQFGNNTLRKVKTDKKDAVKIARYALENRDELREYTSDDVVRDALKSFVKQFNFQSKTLSAHKNNLKALLERVFPGIDDFFSSAAKSNWHQKLIDFAIFFWHNDMLALKCQAQPDKQRRKYRQDHQDPERSG
jgi:transposase